MSLLDHFGLKRPGTVGVKEGNGFSLGHVDTLPVCNAATRGEERLVQGGSGVADRKVVCLKSAADTYAWQELGSAALDDRYVNVTGDVSTGDQYIQRSSPTRWWVANGAPTDEKRWYMQASDDGNFYFGGVKDDGTAADNAFYVARTANAMAQMSIDTDLLSLGSGGTVIKKIIWGSYLWDPANIADHGVGSGTATLTGAQLFSPCFANFSGMGTADWMISAHVQATDTVRWVLSNRTGGAADLGAGYVQVVCFVL